MIFTDYDDNESEREELRAQDRSARHYQRRLIANPDCRDPDHPGCESCMDDEEGSQ